MFTPTEAQGTAPLFLLEIDYHGELYRFAEQAINLADGTGYKNYNNILRDFSYSESTALIGIDIEGNSVSCAVIFDSINIVQQWRKGFTLEGQVAELSYVLLRDGIPQQDYEDRVLVYKGLIQGPVFGDPLEPIGFASFSIERKPYDFSRTILKPQDVISALTFTKHDDETAGGKPYPIVIGQPGRPKDANGLVRTKYCTPCYMIEKNSGSGDNLFMIAGHAVQATQVQVRDEAKNNVTLNVLSAVDYNGQAYSYVNFTGSALVYPGKTLFGNSDEVTNVKEWWVSWYNGGGMLNPFGDGMLKGGGDICRWALLLSGVEVDYGAWGNAAVFLNGFIFAGYINDATITAWEWVSSQIIPFLPVEVTAGVKGIRPILALVYASRYVKPANRISSNSDFLQAGPLETLQDTTELLNSVTIRYAKNGFDQDMSMLAGIGPNFTDYSYTAEYRDDIYSSTAANRYGLLELTIDAEFIYDRETAFYVAHTMVKSKAFPMIQINYNADNKFGYLHLGDIIQFTDSNLYFEDVIATVLGKEWQEPFWRYIIGIENAAILLARST